MSWNWEQPRFPTLPSAKGPTWTNPWSIDLKIPWGPWILQETAPAGFPARPSLKNRIWGWSNCTWRSGPWSLGNFRWILGKFLLVTDWGTKNGSRREDKEQPPLPTGTHTALAQPHPKKQQDLHPSSEAPRKLSPNLMGKNTPGVEKAQKSNSSQIRLLRPQGNGADSLGNLGQFWDSAPKSRLQPGGVEPTEQRRKDMEAMRIQGNQTRPPRG